MSRTDPALAAAYAQLLARAGETQVELRLDATRRACEILGDVHTAAPVVMLTGTNGKTSTARMIDSLLTAHGLRVGRFTSPHLHEVTERISVDGSPVPAEDFVRIHEEIAPYLQLVDGELQAVGRPPLTFFEALTVLAFAVFADAPVDIVVAEVGMGGQWDSTNVADAAVCVFTPIGLDHQAFLGGTIEEIARTKAGILDRTVDPSPAPDPIAVIGLQSPEAAAVLDDEVAARDVEARRQGRNFGVLERTRAVDGQVLDIAGTLGRYPDLFLPLHGAHQAENAALALATAEAVLGDEDKPLDFDTVAEGFSQMSSPGRAEVVRTEPTILVDGAHNPAGAEVLANTLEDAFDFSFTVMVLAMFSDKDPHGVLEAIHRQVDRIVVTRTLSERAMDVEELAGAAREWLDADDVLTAPDMNAALMQAIDLVHDSGETGAGIVVTGSLFTVAEARTLLRKAGEES